MKVRDELCGKKFFALVILLLLVLGLLNAVSPKAVEASTAEYPAIYVDPVTTEDPTLTPGKNYTISIETNYNGSDIWSWAFNLTYDPRVLHGGIRKTDTWIGDNLTETFYTTGKPIIADSEVVYVDETLMTRETEGNDTWTGDNVTRNFYTTGKPVVPDSEVVYVDETLMTRKTKGNDTWTGDGVTKKFNTTHKPLLEEPPAGEEVRVWVNGTLKLEYIHYNVTPSEGVIEFTDTAIPGVDAEIKAEYYYGHYYVTPSEGVIEFYKIATPAEGAEVKATYEYVQYSVDYAKGGITFTTAPSEGAKAEVKYLYGGLTNGDLITTEKHSGAQFHPGTFNNTIGKLSMTGAEFLYFVEPAPTTSGPGTLANITFTVVGYGACNITLGLKTALSGFTEGGYGDLYPIIDAETMPDHIQHGFFLNLAIYVDPVTTVDPTLTPGKNYTISIKTNYNGSDIWGWAFSLTYDPNILHGINVTNGNLITKEKNENATFQAGTFNNTLGKLSLTGANFSYSDPPLPLTSGPGTLSNVTFAVVGRGTSAITLGDETKLIGGNATTAEKYNIIDSVTPGPGHILHGSFANMIHDIAVTNVTASPKTVRTGEPVSINVTATNEGDYNETFDVTVYYDNTTIGTQTVTELASDASQSLTFNWDTTGVTLGNYTISAVADSVPGETDTTDNTFTDGTVTIVKIHDVAVTDVTPSKIVVEEGYSLPIDVTIENQGDYTETFNLTVYANTSPIQTITVTNLTPGNQTTIAFTWDTTGVTLGNYTISAVADSVPGETDTTDNTFTDGDVTLEEAPSPDILPYAAAAGAIAIVIAAAAIYFLKIRKPKPT